MVRITMMASPISITQLKFSLFITNVVDRSRRLPFVDDTDFVDSEDFAKKNLKYVPLKMVGEVS